MANHKTIKIAGLTADVYEPQDGSNLGHLLFCHGAWVGAWVWERLAPWFADHGYVCVAPTWRGHYDSAKVEDLGKVSLLDYVEDARSVYNEIGPQAVIGESMGGLIALKLAESEPSMKALVLMNPAPPFRVPTSPKVMLKQIRYLPDLLFGKSNLPSSSDYKELLIPETPEPEASEFYKRICAESGTALREMSLGSIKVDKSLLACPIYLAIGHRDAIVPLKSHQKVGELLSARVADYPEMSHHTFYDEGWEQVASDLASWLKETIG